MSTAELIAVLQRFPPTTPVWVSAGPDSPLLPAIVESVDGAPVVSPTLGSLSRP